MPVLAVMNCTRRVRLISGFMPSSGRSGAGPHYQPSAGLQQMIIGEPWRWEPLPQTRSRARGPEKLLVPQVRSILNQLGPDDELIVVDDCSSEGTVDAIRRLADPPIAVHLNDRNRR